jgi:hypothetical protein
MYTSLHLHCGVATGAHCRGAAATTIGIACRAPVHTIESVDALACGLAWLANQVEIHLHQGALETVWDATRAHCAAFLKGCCDAEFESALARCQCLLPYRGRQTDGRTAVEGVVVVLLIETVG